ncbi:DNA cytosine methyltransferase, partial [Vibrio fluvialis]|nr:DNA cytosine methyltransferase [Vibrio fluvialis]
EIKEALGDGFPYHKLEKGLGYKIEHRILSACDYGAPTIRKRLFLIGRNDGQPIEWPEATHGPAGSGLLPYATAADIIDWSIPVKSIFGRKKPLAEKTMQRIAKGLEKFVLNSDNPFIVSEENQTPFITEHANASNQRNMPA